MSWALRLRLLVGGAAIVACVLAAQDATLTTRERVTFGALSAFIAADVARRVVRG